MIPAELRQLPQWVTWRSEERNGRQTKIPTTPHAGYKASSTDPTTWTSYREALADLSADGIGFVFSPSDLYTGIDMDNCVSDTGAIHPAAYDVLAALDGYVEFSPSGRGLHIIVRAHLPRGRHTLQTEWGDEFAAYSSGRFFTMSGDGRGTIREAQAELNALVAYYFPEDDTRPRRTPPKPICDDDAAVVDKLLGEPRMARLWAGDTSDHGGDHSVADLALCAHLAFFTGNDEARMDAIYRRSSLMRDKWDEPRGESTYGADTIRKAIGGR